jgi:hypothetical protein
MSMAHTNQLSTFRSDVATLCKILIINCEPRSEKMLREMIALGQTLWLESGEAMGSKWQVACSGDGINLKESRKG